ncbi:MAG: GNAT family N-acetyltransferase [Betaproteobacteria bacterium]|nr:GNAT family N-acetyltransferase [Betaproteobacteria bacterium]
MTMQIRAAKPSDIDTIGRLMAASIGDLQRDFLTPAEIDSSRAIMGVDTRLIEDGTYYVAEIDGELAGCGGWSRRRTLYGADVTTGRDESVLDPAVDAARIRAMYTHPKHVGKGVARAILARSEAAARAKGFTRIEFVSTLAGVPLYTACGYVAGERFADSTGGVPVPLVRMAKQLG